MLGGKGQQWKKLTSASKNAGSCLTRSSSWNDSGMPGAYLTDSAPLLLAFGGLHVFLLRDKCFQLSDLRAPCQSLHTQTSYAGDSHRLATACREWNRLYIRWWRGVDFGGGCKDCGARCPADGCNGRSDAGTSGRLLEKLLLADSRGCMWSSGDETEGILCTPVLALSL